MDRTLPHDCAIGDRTSSPHRIVQRRSSSLGILRRSKLARDGVVGYRYSLTDAFSQARQRCPRRFAQECSFLRSHRGSRNTRSRCDRRFLHSGRCRIFLFPSGTQLQAAFAHFLGLDILPSSPRTGREASRVRTAVVRCLIAEKGWQPGYGHWQPATKASAIS